VPVNPYQDQLGKADPLSEIAVAPQRMRDLVERLGSNGLERSWGPGKWNARQIICHLADVEVAFAFRIRQALAEDRHVIQPFDESTWAKPYASLDARAAADSYVALRRWNLALLETLPKHAFSKPLNHPERGDMVFRDLIATMAGHDLNHLRQLEQISADGKLDSAPEAQCPEPDGV
jgi:hypothetical protein